MAKFLQNQKGLERSKFSFIMAFFLSADWRWHHKSTKISRENPQSFYTRRSEKVQGNHRYLKVKMKSSK